MRASYSLDLARLARAGCLAVLLFAASVGVSLAQTPQGGTLTVQSGTVAVTFANGSAVQPASSGLTLNVGDRIGTLGNSSALITFFEGSELEVGPNATIILREINSSGNEVHLTVEDVLGTAVGRVSAFASPNSSYRMQSPGGQTVALIRGSLARMTIFGSGGTVVTVDECHQICEIDYQGQSLYEGSGAASFGISSSGTITQQNPANSTNPVDPNGQPGGGGGEDSGDGSSDPGYGLREPTPLSALWSELRERDGLNPLSTAGSLFALGLIGAGLAGKRRRP